MGKDLVYLINSLFRWYLFYCVAAVPENLSQHNKNLFKYVFFFINNLSVGVVASLLSLKLCKL
jgi:hypothetical protein